MQRKMDNPLQTRHSAPKFSEPMHKMTRLKLASSSFCSLAAFGMATLLTMCAHGPSPKATPEKAWTGYRKAMEPVLKLLPADGRAAVKSSVEREHAPEPAASGEKGALPALQKMESRVTRSLELAGRTDLLAALDRSTHAWWRHAAQQFLS